MTKAELIETLANKLPMNKADAEKAINIVLEDVIMALKQGQRVNISGFGTFSVSDRQARTGRNPKDRRIDSNLGEPLSKVQTRQAVEGFPERRPRGRGPIEPG